MPASSDALMLTASKSELVLMVEFKVISDSRLEGLREVRQDKEYEGRLFEFEVNGTIHGKRIMQEGL